MTNRVANLKCVLMVLIAVLGSAQAVTAWDWRAWLSLASAGIVAWRSFIDKSFSKKEEPNVRAVEG